MALTRWTLRGMNRGLAFRRSPGLYSRSGGSLPVNSPLASGE